MKLNEITETGFYTGELDNKREIIYEVINNTDKEWLKETPEQKLLIDEWTYEYTDEDNRKHYEILGGNLVAVVNAEPINVIKISDTKYTMDVSNQTIASKCNGTAMMEAKPTRLEIAQQQLDQLKAENEELKNTVDYLRREFKNIKWTNKAISKQCENLNCKDLQKLKAENEHLSEKEKEARHYLKEAEKFKNCLTEIKEIAEPYQKEIKKICGNCNNYDDCHACCKFDLNCYQYKKGDTTACEKFIVSWKYDKNELANKILQKINEVENGN